MGADPHEQVSCVFVCEGGREGEGERDEERERITHTSKCAVIHPCVMHFDCVLPEKVLASLKLT